ncbi:MAG: O-antigen ligase family protein [Elusimicrobiota bacterium]|jgi:tetratricopeptide (TPR) repeat protein
MTLTPSLKTQTDALSLIRLRFDFWVLLGVVALAPFCAAAVDLWAQTLIHVTLIGLACRWVLNNVALSKEAMIYSRLWACLLVTLGISTFFSGCPVRSQQEFWLWVDYALIFFLTGRLSSDEQKKFITALFWTWSLLCLWALGQFFFRHAALQASLLNPNLLAGYLLIPFFAGLERLNDSRSRLWPVLFLILTGGTLIRTGSIGAFLGFAAGLLYLSGREQKGRRQNRSWFLMAVLILLGGVLWKFSAGGDPHRWLWWQATLQMAAVHPFRGLGPGSFEMAIPHLKDLSLYSLYAHSTLLQWLAENGLLFLSSLAALWIYALRGSHRPFLAAGVIAVIVHNTIDYSLLIPAHAFLFWSLLSLCSGPWAAVTSHRHLPYIIRATGLTIGCAGAWLALSYFQADRWQAKAEAAFRTGDYAQAGRWSEEATRLSPGAAAPYELRSRLALEEARTTSHSGPLLEALAGQLSALEREPVRTSYWRNTLQLYTIAGMPQAAGLLRQELLSAAPYLKNDKRF